MNTFDFVKNFVEQLWKNGVTSHLDFDTHAGQAWIGIRSPLGHYGQHRQYTPQNPTHHHHHYNTQTPSNRSPSYYCHQQRRKAANTTDTNVTITNVTPETPAEEADFITPTEKVVNPHQAQEPEINNVIPST